MVGSAAEYERLALAALRKAGTDGSDPTYHNARAHIYATLAIASASEASAGRAGKSAKAAKASTGNEAKALPAGKGSGGA
jgi:hypothetical protein